MKKNFFKFLLLGALTFVVGAGFVGCKDYDDDINEMEKRISLIEKSIEEIEEAIKPGSGDFVTNVSKQGNNLVISYSKAPDKPIELDGAGGGNGYSIGEDGYWYKGGVKTSTPVSSKDDNVVTINLPDATGTLVAINLPGAVSVSDISKIELLGQVDGAVALATGNNATLDIHDGTVVDNADLGVYYAWVENFYVEKTKTGAADGVRAGTDKQKDDYVWTGKTTVNKGVVLNTLGKTALDAGLLIQVTPAGLDLSKAKFSLQNSQNVVLPIGFDPPVSVTSLLTKAAAKSGIWYVPFTYQDKTFANANALKSGYTDLFKTDAIYTLVVDDFRSDAYTPWTVTATKVEDSQEVELAELVAGSTKTTYTADMKINTQTAYSATFNVGSSMETSNGNSAVIDYYFEGVDAKTSSDFGLQISKPNGTFTITKLPDNYTGSKIELYVYKLSVTGDIYVETISVEPIRKSTDITVDLSAYTIIDRNKNGTDSLSADITIDLQKMFDQMDADQVARWQSANADIQAQEVILTKITNGTSDVTANFKADAAAAAKGNPAAKKTTYQILDKSNADVKAATALHDAAKIILTPTYGYGKDGTNYGTFDLTKTTTFTFAFEDKDNNVLNTLNVTVTPQIPALGDLIKRSESFWTGNTLNAYYKVPETWAAGDIRVSGTTVSTTGNANAADSTFYVFGPAGNTGGFTDLGGKQGTDQKWIAAPTFTFADGKYNPGNANAADIATISNDTVFLRKQFPAPGPGATAANGYGQELAVKVGGGAYLGVYSYTADQYAEQAFKIKVMSPLYEGSLEPKAGGISIPAGSAGQKIKLTAEHIKGKTWNNVDYSVFMEYDPDQVAAGKITSDSLYVYKYIKSVTFSIPTGENSKYYIYKQDGTRVENSAVEVAAIAPTTDGKVATASYVSIEPTNPSATTTAKIKVTVTDRFGKVKTEEIPFTITAGTAAP